MGIICFLLDMSLGILVHLKWIICQYYFALHKKLQKTCLHLHIICWIQWLWLSAEKNKLMQKGFCHLSVHSRDEQSQVMNKLWAWTGLLYHKSIDASQDWECISFLPPLTLKAMLCGKCKGLVHHLARDFLFHAFSKPLVCSRRLYFYSCLSSVWLEFLS